MQQKKWQWPIFTCLIGAMMNNAFDLMSEKDSKITYLQFLDNVIKQHFNTCGKPSNRRKRICQRASDVTRYDHTDHLIICDENSGRRCKVCSVKSKFSCEKCQVGLHPKSFKEYHTQ